MELHLGRGRRLSPGPHHLSAVCLCARAAARARPCARAGDEGGTGRVKAFERGGVGVGGIPVGGLGPHSADEEWGGVSG